MHYKECEASSSIYPLAVSGYVNIQLRWLRGQRSKRRAPIGLLTTWNDLKDKWTGFYKAHVSSS